MKAKTKSRTLNLTWTLCIKMWKEISEVYDGTISVHTLKQTWLRDNGFDTNTIYNACFFCDYGGACESCPGRLVKPYFNCTHSTYNYEYNPVEFYKELLRLNKIRKGKWKIVKLIACINKHLLSILIGGQQNGEQKSEQQ